MAISFDVLAAQGVSLSGTSFEFCLHGERDLESQRCDGGEHQLADRSVRRRRHGYEHGVQWHLRCTRVGRDIPAR